MKHKTWLLVCVFCAMCVGFLAYQAGANTPKLDPHYQNYNDLNASNKNDQISQQMRNGLLNRLATRIQNHEARISALAANAKEPTLTSAQMNFNKHQSNESNHNRLTRDMRNDLLNMLTFAITNHEARLVQAEINCKPTTTKQYQCVGSYVQSSQYETCIPRKDIPKPNLACRCGPRQSTRLHVTSMEYCKKNIPELSRTHSFFGIYALEREQIEKKYCDVGFRQ